MSKTRQLWLAVRDLNRSAAIAAVANGAHPMSALESVIRERDAARLDFVLELVTPECLNDIRALALRLYMIGNFPEEYRELKKWTLESRKNLRHIC